MVNTNIEQIPPRSVQGAFTVKIFRPGRAIYIGVAVFILVLLAGFIVWKSPSTPRHLGKTAREWYDLLQNPPKAGSDPMPSPELALLALSRETTLVLKEELQGQETVRYKIRQFLNQLTGKGYKKLTPADRQLRALTYLTEGVIPDETLIPDILNLLENGNRAQILMALRALRAMAPHAEKAIPLLESMAKEGANSPYSLEAAITLGAVKSKKPRYPFSPWNVSGTNVPEKLPKPGLTYDNSPTKGALEIRGEAFFRK